MQSAKTVMVSRTGYWSLATAP